MGRDTHVMVVIAAALAVLAVISCGNWLDLLVLAVIFWLVYQAA